MRFVSLDETAAGCSLRAGCALGYPAASEAEQRREGESSQTKRMGRVF